MNNYKPVTAILRGFIILEIINENCPCTIRYLHKKTGLPKPTLVRILETLTHAGYVRKDPSDGSYSLTPRVLLLSNGYDLNDQLVSLAAPILRDFRRSVPWPSDLAVFDRDAMVIVDTSREPGVMALNRSIGTRMPMLASALGRAYLAFCSKSQRAAIIDMLQTSPNPLERAALDPETTNATLDRYREQGYSVNDKDLSPQTCGIGIPIRVGGNVIACLNMIALADVTTPGQLADLYLRRLEETANLIAGSMEKQEDRITDLHLLDGEDE